MKNIPIVILNKDRLEPLKKLTVALTTRGYTNIHIIDNRSTYQPLLDWYAENASNYNVFFNTHPETKFDTGTFYHLAYDLDIEPFVSIVKDFYIFTDSDVIPTEDVPEDFVNDMIRVYEEYFVDKVGLGLKIDDLPEYAKSQSIVEYESPHWQKKLLNDDYELYMAAIDTTFALYGPNSKPLWSGNAIRMGGSYMAHHAPWYYNPDNLPVDEKYYITHLEPNKGPTYSMRLKEDLLKENKL